MEIHNRSAPHAASYSAHLLRDRSAQLHRDARTREHVNPQPLRIAQSIILALDLREHDFSKRSLCLPFFNSYIPSAPRLPVLDAAASEQVVSLVVACLLLLLCENYDRSGPFLVYHVLALRAISRD